MSLGDIAFIAAFIVLPLIIVALSVMALQTLNRRQHRPLARFSSDDPVQSTQELPIAPRDGSRDWAATVQPTRGPAKQEEVRSTATQPFKVPTYRGRATGVVRRITFQSRPIPRPQQPDPPAGHEDPQP